MGLRIFALACLFACSAQGLSLYKGDQEIRATDFGPAIQKLIYDVVKNLTAEGPIPLLPGVDKLEVNLTQVVQAIIGEGASNPIKGMMHLSDPALIGLESLVVVNSSMILNGIIQPIKTDVDVILPGIGISGIYDIDALLLGILPVKGQGDFHMAINIGAGFEGSLKALPPMQFTTFQYLFDLKSIDVNFDGLIGGPDLSAQINLIINDFVDKEITPAFSNIEVLLHKWINAIIHDTLDLVVGGLTYAELLEILNALLRP